MLRKNINKKDIEFILKNLRNEDIEELKALWGNDWYMQVNLNLKDKNFYILYGKDKENNEIPIAMGGFSELFEKNAKIACVWLLSSKFISQNKNLLMKTLRIEIEKAEKIYDIMYNYIYKSNFEAKNWLKKLGFNFNNPYPENLKLKKDFEFFYKISYRKDI